jgi:hypothetical protein
MAQLQITPAVLSQTYRGKPGKCCCGCSGNYYEDAKTMQRCINKVAKHIANGGEYQLGGTYMSADIGNVQYNIYFNDNWNVEELNGVIAVCKSVARITFND